MALMTDLIAEYQPATTNRTDPRRKNGAEPNGSPSEPSTSRAKPSYKRETGVPKNLGLLIRYHTSAERAFHRAHNELVKTQKERKKSEIGFVPQNAAQPPRRTT